MIKTKSLTIIALFAALIAISSYFSISLPFSPTPLTLQTFAVLLCGLLLSPKYASSAVGLWAAMGAIGLPVFHGGQAGFGVIFGPTGGYIIGFVFAAGLIALLRGKTPNLVQFASAAAFGNFLVIYPLGIAGLMLVTNLSLDAALAAGATPFIVGDIVKIIAAVAISLPIHQRIGDLLI